MTSQTKETAEQKLLKMIESSSNAGSASSKTKPAPTVKASVVSVLKVSNKFLIVGVLIASVFLFNEVRLGVGFAESSFYAPQTVGSKVLPSDDSGSMIAFPELAVYLSSMKDRNIFAPFEKVATKKTVDVSSQNRHIAHKTRAYRLVGISWFDSVDTASVMLEDVEQKRTYFLQKGEKVGDIFVKTIYADSVALGYENEEIIIGYDKTQK